MPGHGGQAEREAPGLVGRRMQATAVIVVSAGRNERGLRLASVNSCSGLWGVGTVPSCLVPWGGGAGGW